MLPPDAMELLLPLREREPPLPLLCRDGERDGERGRPLKLPFRESDTKWRKVGQKMVEYLVIRLKTVKGFNVSQPPSRKLPFLTDEWHG